MTTGIICVCLPPLPILFRRPRTATNTAYSDGSRRGPHSADRYGDPKRSGLCDDSYFELDDISQAEIRPDGGVVTRVKGGHTDDARWKMDDNGPPGLAHVRVKRNDEECSTNRRENITNGIMRTVKIEQQAV